jgi:hypothetical protein
MGNVTRSCVVLAALCMVVGVPAEGQSDANAPADTAMMVPAEPPPDGERVPDNMTKFGPKLSEEELAEIAGLSVPELADMLRNGDTMRAYAALRQLKADGGARRNLDLLLSIAAETRGGMIVQGLVQPVEASAGDEEKQTVDKLLDLLEAELAKEMPSVSPADAARSIAGAVHKELHSPVVYRRRDTDEIDRLMAVPYGFDRAVALLVSCLDSEDREARLTAARWLGYVGGTDPGAVTEIAARLRAWRVAEIARAEELEEEDRRASAARAAERIFERALRDIQRRLETRERLLSPARRGEERVADD